VHTQARLPEPLEVAAYYVVSEALANTAKHAQASEVHVAVEVRDGALQLSIRDDGRGGADPARGSGLVGLADRVEAFGGTIDVASPLGRGTTLSVTLPIEEARTTSKPTSTASTITVK
jgi:signal transduction histidine kinase